MQFVSKVLRSFTYAAQGIIDMVSERNMRVHIAAAVLIVFSAIFFRVTLTEWFIILILISLVFALEMINTAVEDLANIVRDELKLDYAATRKARDVAAGAVFVVAIIAALVGITIFLPYILTFVDGLAK
jgi:undecaprenol kinase